MSIDLSPLLEKAFFAEEVQNASEAIEHALEKFEHTTHTSGRPYEFVAPTDPDEPWLRDQLVARLVYVCESEGAPVPKCGSGIVALFVGRWLYGIPAEDVVRWASERLGTSVEQLRAQYGTHELETALR
ncbi:MAG TPA: STAUR_1299 family protein [Kofleriaceae bacterium]